MPMADAIDNLAQDLNQTNTPVDEFPGYPGYQLGQEVPGMAGVRVGDLFYGYDPHGQEAPYNWRTGVFEYQAAPQDLSNPSTFKTGEGIDFNIRDQPVDRINVKSGDEQDAIIRTEIGTKLDPKTEDRYGVQGLVSPDKVGGFIGVEQLTPKEVADLKSVQIPSSLPENITTRGEPIGRTFEDITQRPDYSVPIGFNRETGDIVLANKNNIRDTVVVPSGRSISQADIERGVSPNVTIPTSWNQGINTELAPSQKTPTSVGATEPSTASVGGFDNIGGNVTVGPDNRASGPGVDDTIRFNPDYKPKPEVKPGDEFKNSPWRIFTGGKGKDDGLSDYRDPNGELFPTDQHGYKWNYRTEQFDCLGGICSQKEPVKDTGTTPGTGTGTTPTPGSGGQPPTGGIKPGGGITGPGTYTGTPLPPRSPVTPLVRSEVVIPTKPLREVPLPDRQADPFAKLYADLLANSSQEDKYRYINYDPDQIMNAAMSGFRRRGAMRSLQG